MCISGVREFVEQLVGTDLSVFDAGQWESVRDGFGVGKAAPQLLAHTCPRCHGSVPIIKRTLESCAYNLPDVAVYQRLRFGQPCIALGVIDAGKTNVKYPPCDDVRRRWQGLMWYVYQVAFVDVKEGIVGKFCPATNWAVRQPLCELANIVVGLEQALAKARDEGLIPVGDRSVCTEYAAEEVLSPILHGYGYRFDGMHKVIPSFWHGPGNELDLAYTKDGQNALAVEVKVNEDWDHPICQPVQDLLCYNAVLNIRVPSKKTPKTFIEVQEFVSAAETMLETTGRARSIRV